MADQVRKMIEQGQDPKEMLMEQCKPECTHWSDRLLRCEAKLEAIQAVDPEKSCMYPLRDYVTCLEGCVQPKIHHALYGNEPGRIFY